MTLLTLVEAKAQLDIETSGSDDELQAYIDAMTAVIERYVGPIEIRTVTETVQGRSDRLSLSQVPAVSLTSVTPATSAGGPLVVTDLVLDPAPGIVRRTDGGFFTGGPWVFVYEAGRGAVPPTVNLAARILLQHLWRTRYGAARGNGPADDYNVNEPAPGWGYAVPNRVLQLLEPFKVPSGFA